MQIYYGYSPHNLILLEAIVINVLSHCCKLSKFLTLNTPLHTAAIRKLFSVMQSCRSECIMREREDEYEISNHHRAYSPISCWLCFLLCLRSKCTLLIPQLLSSYRESSIPALLHPHSPFQFNSPHNCREYLYSNGIFSK